MTHTDTMDLRETLLEGLDEPLTANHLPADGDLSELDSLLAESLAAQAERAEVKAARERIKRGGLSAEQAALDNALVALWADQYEWQSVTTAGIFNRYTCACGATHTVFDCVMVEQKHRGQPFTRRWINPSTEHRAQPRSMPAERTTIVREHQVGVCGACAPQSGWRLEGATIWKG